MSKAHFIGICGAGMSAVAKLLQDQGWEISGSDAGFYPPISDYLTRHNLPCATPHDPQNIPADANLIIIGRHAKLTPETNPEVKAAFNSGIPIKSFPEVLSDLTKKTNNFIITGSYGKSTCSALASWCLLKADRDPSYFIGAVPETPPESSHLGQGQEFILEGDEYPSANWDDSSKFLHYHPRHILLTSLTHDHINVFPRLEDYLKPFSELIKLIPQNGSLIACLDGEHVPGFIKKYFPQAITYSLNNPRADWTASNINYGTITSFDLNHQKKKIASIQTSLLGQHNIENIVGVAAILLSSKVITPEELLIGIKTFKTLSRRLDLKSTKTKLKIYEGFGSSYAKALAAIQALKLHYPHQRLLIIFEPHTFSWRNRDYLHQYDTVFKDADEVFIYKPPTHGALTHNQITLEDILERVKKSGLKATGFENPTEGLKLIKNEWREDDIVLILTSGNLDGLLEKIPATAEEQFPV